MGTGKSTIGKLLAKHLSLPFVDTDLLIEQKLKMPIEKIFKKHGEPFFRAEEQKLLQQIRSQAPCIASLGGGMVLSSANRDILRDGFWINLKLTPALIFDRIKNEEKRPLLGKKPKREDIENILKARQPYYDQAPHQIDISGLSPEGVVEEILEIVKKY